MTALPPVDPTLSDQTRTAIVCAAYEVLLGREADAGGLATMKPPAWTVLHGPRSPLSSTAIRAARKAAAAANG